MKSILFFGLILLVSFPSVQAQSNGDTYKYFDADWKPTKEKKAIYLLRIQKKDSCWQFSYYNMFGPLVRVETYQDEKRTIRQGLFAWYNADGRLDSSGYYDKGIPDKNWTYMGTGNVKGRSLNYDKGRLLSDKEAWDMAIANGMDDPLFPDFSRPSPESYFKGEDSGWIMYLNKNLKYPDRAVQNLVRGTVVVVFKIAPTGATQDPVIYQSIELSLDDEARRMIVNSPAWVPAIQGKRRVRSFKKLPIVFKLEFQ